jgi:hypothetical protein
MDAAPILALGLNKAVADGLGFPIPDTGQTNCYDADSVIAAPASGEAFYGQDAQIYGYQPHYTLSGDGLTVLDNVTGLSWVRDPDLDGDGDIDVDDKLDYADAQSYPATLNAIGYGGYNDWRIPSIKELYSLMDSRQHRLHREDSTPYLDTGYSISRSATRTPANAHRFEGSRRTIYVASSSSTSQGCRRHFADGRINVNRSITVLCSLCARQPGLRHQQFVDNSDGTITTGPLA